MLVSFFSKLFGKKSSGPLTAYFIDIPKSRVVEALSFWSWLPLPSYTDYKVTAFGDVFLFTPDGPVWFLDAFEGNAQDTFDSREAFEAAMQVREDLECFCSAVLVDGANARGLRLSAGQCYDWKIHPVIGGSADLENVTASNFVLASSVAGQLHQQTAGLPEGAAIDGVETVVD